VMLYWCEELSGSGSIHASSSPVLG
jgi:hypothetical protein